MVSFYCFISYLLSMAMAKASDPSGDFLRSPIKTISLRCLGVRG
jgi:hypothetical protein